LHVFSPLCAAFEKQTPGLLVFRPQVKPSYRRLADWHLCEQPKTGQRVVYLPSPPGLLGLVVITAKSAAGPKAGGLG
jgi:hypothetical protein